MFVATCDNCGRQARVGVDPVDVTASLRTQAFVAGMI